MGYYCAVIDSHTKTYSFGSGGEGIPPAVAGDGAGSVDRAEDLQHAAFVELQVTQ